jgi:hypothetical protein
MNRTEKFPTDLTPIPEGTNWIDPPHHLDVNAPCPTCGARWVKDAEGTGETMTHTEDCAWMQDDQEDFIEGPQDFE